MNKNIVPEGFTMGMVLSDLLPVVFFGATTFVIGLVLGNIWINLGAVIAFVSGFIKVVWKLIVVKQKKNIWPLFIQMRIAMPIGFVIFLAGLIVSLTKLSLAEVLGAVIGMPQLMFFIFGIIGMAAMIVFSVKLDSSDAKSNWIEQTTNGIAQLCFFVGVLFIYFG